MSARDDLNAALSALSNNASTIASAATVLIDALNSETGGNDAAIAAAATAVANANTSLAATAASMQAAVTPPAPTPTP